MKIFFTLLIVFFISIVSTPAKERFIWHRGTVSLNTGESVEGEIYYNAHLEVVVCKMDRRVETYSSSKVDKFQYYDAELEIARKYVSHYYNESSTYKVKVFFEIVLSGNVALLRRNNKFSVQGYSDYFTINDQSFDSNSLNGYTYYSYYNDEFVNLRKFKKQLLPMLKGQFGPELSNYIAKYNLKSHVIKDQILIVDYYNFLSNTENSILTSNNTASVGQ